ncbi:hypothetical protein [Haliangium ochraceum]|uniref:Lipoprotein n=1 Tax=Haliangium ochraceum (strain DSM 14365 / JCM 11303 / SMP-2) TaxID=502025 RepID=D0LXC7_HALO1|nr:hypothetical protein [Haliangium ochraceum]ACY16169.1 hypothetical protein Hoch_3668 [Haliangium ochraceum DSM 14365]
MKRIFSTTLTLCSLSLLLGACGGDDELSNEDYDDIAVGVGSLVAVPGGEGGETGSLNDVLEASISAGTSAAEGASSVEIVVHAGVSYEYRLDCYDAAGALQDACGADTDSAEASVDWSGELDTPSYDASIMRVGDWSLSGLQSDTAVFSGTGSFDIETSFSAMYRDVERTLSLSYDASYDDITIDIASRRVTGGAIHYNIDGARYDERGARTKEIEFAVTADLSFTGDGEALLVLDGSRSYVVDLDTGAVAAE